ncbi:hypothetical protein PSPO01_04485 [Paraphaeosphaeria sporulosa]
MYNPLRPLQARREPRAEVEPPLPSVRPHGRIETLLPCTHIASSVKNNLCIWVCSCELCSKGPPRHVS